MLEQARECHDEGVAVAVFPELCLTGYAIDDLLLQDTLLDGGARRRSPTIVDGIADLLPVLVVGAPLVHGTRVLNCAVVIHRGRVLGVAPKSYLPTYREFYERRHFAPGDDRRGATIDVCGAEVPFGPDLIFAAADLPDLALHVEICEDMWVPVPPSAEAVAGRRDRAGQPVRQPDHRRPRRGPPAAGPHAPARAATRRTSTPPPGQGESTTDLSLGRPDDGLRVRRAARREPSASPTGRAARSPTSTSTGSARSGCGRAPSTTTGARYDERVAAFRTVEFELDRADR